MADASDTVPPAQSNDDQGTRASQRSRSCKKRGNPLRMPIREEYLSTKTDDGKYKVIHIACKGNPITRSAVTMYNHLQECPKTTKEVKEKYNKDGYYSDSYRLKLEKQECGQSNISLDSILDNILNENTSESMSCSKDEQFSRLCDQLGCLRLRKDHLKLLQQVLCNWTISKTIAPNVFNDPHWKLFALLMRPDFITPSASRLTGDLLNSRHVECEKVMKSVESVCLCVCFFL